MLLFWHLFWFCIFILIGPYLNSIKDKIAEKKFRWYSVRYYEYPILASPVYHLNKDIVEWIPKWQNKIDAWFSGRLFSKMARKSWIFHISHNRKLCMGQKWQKLQIQDLLNEVYPKGLIFKMTLFSPIDLDKIMPKNPK